MSRRLFHCYHNKHNLRLGDSIVPFAILIYSSSYFLQDKHVKGTPSDYTELKPGCIRLLLENGTRVS